MRYTRDGVARVGSGFLVDHQLVLTAAHCADGVDHVVSRPGISVDEWPAVVAVASPDPVIDLALLRIELPRDSPVPPIEPIPRAKFASINTEQVQELADCIAVGFPKWKPMSPEGFRNPAQFAGSVLTHEYQTRITATAIQTKLFAIKSDRFNDVSRPQAAHRPAAGKVPLTPDGPLEPTPWAGMSGAAVVDSLDQVIGVIRSHNASEGVASLAFTPISLIDALANPEAERFRALIGMSSPARWRSAGTRRASAWSTFDSDNYSPVTFASARMPAPSIHQLPPSIDDFTGREEDIVQLRRLIESEDEARVIINICGPPGAGKSALAIHISHLIARPRTDVQLYAHLGEQEGRIPQARDVLQQFVAALDPATISVPIAASQLPGRYQSLLSDLRSLVVLDDAQRLDQLRDTIPATQHLIAIITSRAPLASLPGIRIYQLSVMGVEESLELLSAASGRALGTDITPTALRLVTLCGRLPLAVRIGGAILKKKKHWSLEKLVSSLEDESTRLAKLAEGALDVRRCFSLSYAQLDASSARAFRLLALLPLRTFRLHHAAIILDAGTLDADQLVEALVDAQLLETSDGKSFRFHDLLRLYGRETAALEQDDPAGVRVATFVRRLTGEFLSDYESCLRSNGWVVARQGYARWTAPSAAISADGLYVRPRLIRDPAGEVVSDWRDLVARDRQVWIEGAGGTGKTTLAERICYDIAAVRNDTSKQFDVGFSAPLRLRGPGDDDRGVERLIVNTIQLKYQLVASEEAIELLLRTKRAVVILDGIDEVPPDDRDLILSEVAAFSQRFPETRVILTSRPEVNFELGEAWGFRRALIAPLDDEAITTYVKRWSHALNSGIDRDPRSLADIGSIGREWLSTPLLLTQMMSLYDRLGYMPRRQVDLYNVMFEAYFGAREIQRGVARLTSLRPEYFGRLVASLAFQLKVRGNYSTRGMSEAEMRSCITACFQNWHHPFSPREIEQVASDLAALNLPVYRAANITRDEQTWWVSRDPFSDYLAARWIVTESESPVHMHMHLVAIVRAVTFRLGCVFAAQLASIMGRFDASDVIGWLRRMTTDSRLPYSARVAVGEALSELRASGP